jgi:carboxyl-terminal processing protease
MRKNIILISFALALGALAAIARQPLAQTASMSDFDVFDPVADVYFQIEERFYRDVDPVALQRGMISGMIESLDDPYTQYIPPAEIEDFDKDVLGEYVGIGAEVNTQEGFMLVVSPMDDSPAYRAGLEAGDLIVAVNGESTFNRDLDEIIESLAGTPGSSVRVTVEREGDASDVPDNALPPSVPGPIGEAPGIGDGRVRFDLEITRKRIVTSTVKGVRRVNDRWSYIIDPQRKLGYVRVSQFTNGTIPELERATRQLLDNGMTGMILDLRFNSGGSLAAAVRMADLFLGDGLIVSTKGREGEQERAYAKERGTLPDFPMIVLVNSASASASEVVSGALSDNGRAVILGERTYGKGIVQSVVALPSGEGHLKVTEQYYYLPSGRSIHRTDDDAVWGVDPDEGFYVPMTNEEYRTMLRVRRQQEIIKPEEEDESEANWSNPEWILEALSDKQLSAAVRALRAKQETGEWQAVGEDVPDGTIELAALRAEQERYELLVKEMARLQARIEALSASAADSEEDPFDIVPGEEDLSGGEMVLRDKDGNLIASFEVGARSLDRWLWDAPITMKPESEPDEASEEKVEATPR